MSAGETGAGDSATYKDQPGNCTQNWKGPLAGLNVVDFGHYYAGPMAAMLLADQGANVIHVCKPGAPEIPGARYRLLNRNKKLLTIDLKTQAGLEQARSLIEKADVLIENFRPGVMKRLGLDYTSCKANNPGLIYLSLPGFASTDKERASLQAWEGVLSAAAGIYTEMSWTSCWPFNYPPVYTPMPLCSAFGALHGAIAVMAALLARSQYGAGTLLETPLLDAGLSGYCWHVALDKSGPLRAIAKDTTKTQAPANPLAYASDESIETQASKRDQAMQSCLTGPFSNFFPCADGRQVVCFYGDNINAIRQTLETLGLYDRLLKEGFINEGSLKPGFNNNLSSLWDLSADSQRYIRELIQEKLFTKTAREWEELTPTFTLVRTREEWLAEESALASGLLVKMDNGKSTLTATGRAADISGQNNALIKGFKEAKSIAFNEAVTFFSNHRSIREQAQPGKQSSSTRTLKKGELLKDLKVLDLCNILAGPLSSYTLAQYGASVIRSEPPGPGHHMPFIMYGTQEVTQGKRHILTNIKTAPGRQVLNRLVNWADLVVHNILDDTATLMGVRHEQLQQINPNVVSCQLSAFGGPLRGNPQWDNRMANDLIAETPTGLITRFGSLETPYPFGRMTCGDSLGGLSLAFCALLGIYQKRMTGIAGEGRTSLVRGVQWSQLPYLISEDGHSEWEDEPHGQLAQGNNWWQRIYPCQDGWLYISARDDQKNLLASLFAHTEQADEAILTTAFQKQALEAALDLLRENSIAAHAVLNIDDICNQGLRQVDNDEADEEAQGGPEVLCRQDHPSGTPIIFTAPTWVRVGENHSYKRLKTGPQPGENTREILRELNYSAQEIDELLRLGVNHERLPAMKNLKQGYFFDLFPADTK